MWGSGGSTSYGTVRPATHAGSWYSGNAQQLHSQIEGWMKETTPSDPAESGNPTVVIGPHAGFRYSGPTAAHSYSPVNPSQGIERVILLGPSHHAYLPQSQITKFKQYETPFGRMDVDLDAVHELQQTGIFGSLSNDNDAEEHSLEMHLPFVQHIMDRAPYKIVPILVGDLSRADAQAAGKVLAKYVDDPHTLIAVSTDFCHWGARFGYTHYEPSWGAVHESIQKLDELGVEAIRNIDPDAYHAYQKKYSNTICGRKAVLTMLEAVRAAEIGDKVVVEYPKYDQSNHATSRHDSSVSYASLVLRAKA